MIPLCQEHTFVFQTRYNLDTQHFLAILSQQAVTAVTYLLSPSFVQLVTMTATTQR